MRNYDAIQRGARLVSCVLCRRSYYSTSVASLGLAWRHDPFWCARG